MKLCFICQKTGENPIFVRKSKKREDVCRECFPEYSKNAKNAHYRHNYYPKYYRQKREIILKKRKFSRVEYLKRKISSEMVYFDDLGLEILDGMMITMS